MPVYFAVSLAARTLVAPLHRVAACCSQVYASSSRSETLLCDHSVRVRSAGVPSGNRAVLVCAEAPHSSSTSMVDAGQKKRKMQEMAASDMIDLADFASINKDMTEYDEKREKVIKDSRDIQKLAKQAIYCLHRGDMEGAATKLAKAEAGAEKLRPIVDVEGTLRTSGSFSSSLEEFAEGRVFEMFLKEGRVPRMAELPMLNRDEFLGGVLDFTGELNRYAVARATERDKDAVQRCRNVINSLMGVFLEFDLRNGALRKKFDALKYTLKKMETTLYEMSLTENLGFQRATEPDNEPPEATRADDDT